MLTSSSPSPCQSDTNIPRTRPEGRDTKPGKCIWLFSRIHKTVISLFKIKFLTPTFYFGLNFATVVHIYSMGFPGSPGVRNPSWPLPILLPMQEMWVWSLGWEDPLEKEKATPSSILAWEIHRQRSLVGYTPWGRKESDRHNRATKQTIL